MKQASGASTAPCDLHRTRCLNEEKKTMSVPKTSLLAWKNLLLVISIALLLGFFCWQYINKPDESPPKFMVDILLAATEINATQQIVEDYFRKHGNFEGVDKIVIPPASLAKNVKSVRVLADGSIVAAIMVRKGSQETHETTPKVEVNIQWRPKLGQIPGILEWTCHGGPAEFIPISCR